MKQHILTVLSLVIINISYAAINKRQLQLNRLNEQRNQLIAKRYIHLDKADKCAKKGRIGGGKGFMAHKVWAQQYAVRIAQLDRQLERLQY